MDKITIGGDPEFFLSKDGEFVGAIGLIPGTKDKPHRLSKGACQLDGLAVEINPDPAETADQFCDHFETTLKEVREIIPKEYKFVFQPSVNFKSTYYDSLPQQFKELGCNPDFNAYTGLVNPSPMEMLKQYPYMRTGAGHITIGWGSGFDKKEQNHILDCESVVTALDSNYNAFKGYWDKDTLRQEMYGKPGAYRPTSFGVEYRVPSNAWLRYPKLWPFMFNLAHGTMISMHGGGPVPIDFPDLSVTKEW